MISYLLRISRHWWRGWSAKEVAAFYGKTQLKSSEQSDLCSRIRTRLVSRQLPLRSTATLAALPAMSLAPLAPFANAVAWQVSLFA